jgi:hypothetical protein
MGLVIILFFIGLFLAGTISAIFLTVITKRAWVAFLICSIAMLLVFRDVYVHGRYEFETLIAPVIFYGLTVLGSAFGVLLSFPFRRWLLLQKIRQN